MLTKAERSARNKAAHAIRRAMTDADYRQAKTEGATITWREVAAVYDTMPTESVLALGLPAPVDATPRAPRGKRNAPAHVQRAQEAFALARLSWEAGLESAMRGAHTLADGGTPANGETYPDEERDYRAAHPAPVFRDYLTAEYAAMRHAADDHAVSA